MNKVFIVLVLFSSIVFSSNAMAISAVSNGNGVHSVFLEHSQNVTWGWGGWGGGWGQWKREFKRKWWTPKKKHQPSHSTPSNSVPEMDAAGGIIAFGLLAGLLGLVRERKLKTR